MSAPLLSARELTLAYEKPNGSHESNQPVLDALSLTVAAGELVAVVGASGSGKSSLLRVLAGLQRPTGGRVEINGNSVEGPHPHIAIAFQEACLLPWLSVEKNVAFGLDFAHQPHLTRAERAQCISRALDEVGLGHARAMFPNQLSGGMAQRVALARCVARQAQLLLLDEPFAALDEVTRAEMQQLLRRVVDDTHAATVLVTHDIDEALLVADRVVLLGNRGHLVGTWHIALPQPRAAYVQELGALRIEILQALYVALGRPVRTPNAQPDSTLARSA